MGSVVKRNSLVPVGENYEKALDSVIDVVSKHGVSLKECLDTDSCALSASDMRYFGREFYGCVPSYGIFIKYLGRLPVDVKDNFMEIITEIESSRYVGEMDKIAYMTGDELSEDPHQGRRFGWLQKLNAVHEKRLARIDSRRKNRGDAEARGVDLAAKLISALSDADLLKIKGKVEAIDAEYKEIEGRVIADGR